MSFCVGIARAEFTPIGPGDNLGLPYAACHPPGLTYYTPGPFANLLWSCGSLWNPVGNWKDKATGADIRRTLDVSGTVIAGSQIDRSGNPQYLVPGQVMNALLTIQSDALLDGHHVYVGKMALTWEGCADIRLKITGTQVTGSTSGLETNGRREWIASQTQGAMYVEIYGIDTNNPPHNICLWAPDPADWNNSTLEGKLLHPSMEARLQDADWGYVRYMDLQSTIMTREKEWQDRRLPTDCFQVGPINTIIPATPWTVEKMSSVGMAYEHIIRMCNETQIDPWICVPFDASPAYMTNMANLFMYGSDGEYPYTSAVTNPAYPPLDSNLKIYLEFANEVWNYRQDDLLADRGVLNNGQYAAQKFSDTWEVFESVLGTNRIVRAAAVWTANGNGFTTDLLNELYGNSSLLKPEVIAGTTYFGSGIQNWVWEQILETNAPPDSYWTSAQFTNDMHTAFDQWERLAMTGIKYGGDTGPDKLDAQGIPDYLRDFCYSKNVPLVCYEGGPSIYTDSIDKSTNPDGVALTDFMIAMNAHPRMAEIYDLQLQMAKEDGLYSHMPFLLYEEWGKFGQWGHLESLHDDPDKAVKYSYILDFIDECKNEVRHVYDPLNNVPSFTTAEELPYILQGLPCNLQIQTTGGDGARSNKVIAALLPDGLSIDSDFRITGTSTETGDFHLYLRVTDSDGDPAWSFFRLTVLEATIGLPLLEWEFLNADELNARTNAFQEPGSTYNAGNMMSSSVGIGPGLEDRDNSLYNDDAYTVLSANSSSMDTNAYIHWTVQPQSEQIMHLYSLYFGITGTSTTDDFHLELQYSLDGFATTGTVVALPTNTFVGGGNTAAGIPVSVPLTAYSELQNCDQPVEFRLYIWGLDSAYARINFGKLSSLTGDETDLRVSGLVSDVGLPPFAPSSLSVTSVNASTLSLSWVDNAFNENGFNIERKSGTNVFSQIAVTGMNSAGYIDSGLMAGTTYTYRLQAFNDTGDSGYSNEASGMPEVKVISTNIIFDGLSDAVFKATSDNNTVSLASAGGTHTLLNSSAGDQDAYIFGNFSETVLTNEGESITLSFTVNNMPDNAGMRFVLAGARGVNLTTADAAAAMFARSYASYGIDKKVDNISADFFNYDGGSAGNTIADRPLLGDTSSKIGSWSSGIGGDRFDNGDTVDFTLTITREAEAFNVAGTMDVTEGSGVQAMTGFSFTPVAGNNDLLPSDAFTTFGVGCQGYAAQQLDAGSSLSISGITVMHTAAGGSDDSDTDGLPDSWETLYFGGSTNANPAATAANGINTVLETYIAGINPTNPAALFWISDFSSLTSETTLQWQNVSGRIYTVYWTSNLLSGFQTLGTNNTGIFTDSVHSAGSEGFYKIDVGLAP
ncbi:hypothetical protein PDESU_03671 [Pontiella desulfatans]|uniref:Fibronectin type-III domain-containing protein n=2 Tax=Pontiella desulfatans TaxID=2750659 RepID=A0A6C2U6E0_PONDE|nr:hypothetical protein PDESU_03671 [Pontiella desulfatans]